MRARGGCTLQVLIWFVEVLTHLFPPYTTQLFMHVGAKDPSELRLVSAESAATFADEAMVSDFPITDESVIYACVGGEEPPPKSQ